MPVELPIGIRQAAHEWRGEFLLAQASGIRPVHAWDERAEILQHFGFDPAEFESFTPHLVRPLEGGGYITWWHSRRRQPKETQA